MAVLIKNANYTSNLEPPFPHKSWLSYWESKKGSLNLAKRYQCPAAHCNAMIYRDEFDGCHVQIASNSTKMYIIPLCSACNHRTDYFFVDEDLLVPVP